MAAPAARRAQRARQGSPAPLSAVAPAPDVLAERAAQREHFRAYLEASTNRAGRPYARRAVATYLEAVGSLERWLLGTAYQGRFTDIDTATLNGYLRWYRATHSQGGTNTKQRNLARFFAFLVEEFDTVSPYQDPTLTRYSPTDPAENLTVLSPDLIRALLKVTSGKDYESVRDHALIRLLLCGLRREEITRLRVCDVDLGMREVATVGLKGNPGRRVAFGSKAALALTRWLRAREQNRRYAGRAASREQDTSPLWLGSRNRSAMTGNGIYQVLRRRAVQAGYPKEAVRPHMFRHTRAHEHLLDGGTEGDLMRQMGWRDRSMVDRYAAHMAAARALEDAHQRALDDRY